MLVSNLSMNNILKTKPNTTPVNFGNNSICFKGTPESDCFTKAESPSPNAFKMNLNKIDFKTSGNHDLTPPKPTTGETKVLFDSNGIVTSQAPNMKRVDKPIIPDKIDLNSVGNHDLTPPTPTTGEVKVLFDKEGNLVDSVNK